MLRPGATLLFLLGAGSFACGDGGGAGALDAVDAGATAVDAALEGSPEILAFTGPAQVGWRGVARLEWRVANASAVEIVGPDGTLVSTFELSGSAETAPLTQTATFTLSARGAGPTVTRSLVVELALAAPVIDAFSFDPVRGVVGASVTAQWSAQRVTRVRLYRDGVRVSEVPGDPELPATGSAQVRLEATRHTLKLEAVGPAGTVSRELIVDADPPPHIRRFVVHPRTLFRANGRATVEWEVTGTATVELLVDMVPLGVPPTTLTGSVSIALDRASDFMLVATLREFADIAALRSSFPLTETEPNGNLENSNDLSFQGGAWGGIAFDGDVDVFTYRPLLPGRFRVSTRDTTGIDCSTDTALRITDFGGVLLGLDADGGAPAPGGGACASVEVTLGEPGGQPPPMVIEVTGERGAIGDYALSIEDL